MYVLYILHVGLVDVLKQLVKLSLPHRLRNTKDLRRSDSVLYSLLPCSSALLHASTVWPFYDLPYANQFSLYECCLDFFLMTHYSILRHFLPTTTRCSLFRVLMSSKLCAMTGLFFPFPGALKGATGGEVQEVQCGLRSVAAVVTCSWQVHDAVYKCIKIKIKNRTT